MTEWIYMEEVFSPPNPNIYEGFIYLIENLVNGKMYIGKKHFWSRQKDRKTKRRVTKESDWRNYYSSSDDLKKDVAELGKDKFKRTILHLCVYAKQMTYLEQKEQWDRSVLLDDLYYNTNIGGKFFVREVKIYESKEKVITTKNEKWREIKSVQMKGENNVAKREDVRKKISEKKKGDKHHMWGKTTTPEHKAAMLKGCMDSIVQIWKITTPEGEEEIIQNLNEYCREKNLNRGAMCLVAQGKRKHHKGYKCAK